MAQRELPVVGSAMHFALYDFMPFDMMMQKAKATCDEQTDCSVATLEGSLEALSDVSKVKISIQWLPFLCLPFQADNLYFKSSFAGQARA